MFNHKTINTLLTLTTPHLTTLLLLLVINTPTPTNCHGRLIEPPSRASAWRYGFQTPPNYNDHELYCGGYTRQWQQNGGKCGICGDAWDLPPPRPHEIGGPFGQGIIVRRYNPKSIITLRVELTANHFGFFEFRLCSNYMNTSQECLDRHVLRLASSNRLKGQPLPDDPNNVKFYPKDGNRIYEMRYRLPNIKCTHCVLQWTYTAGNNWGLCPNGSGAVGCGPQETFRACADISIGDGNNTTEIDTETTTTLITPTEPLPIYNGIKSLIIFLISLFLVILLFSILYIYYYQVGKKIKTWLKVDETKQHPTTKRNDFIMGINLPPPPKIPAPVPPPRARKTSNPPPQMFQIHLGNESIA